MRYESIDELPMVCHYNLPEEALRVYRDAYNAAWQTAPSADRDRYALHSAWRAVRENFVKEKLTGRWIGRDRRSSTPQDESLTGSLLSR
jgi:cation transport regulator ChaB